LAEVLEMLNSVEEKGTLSAKQLAIANEKLNKAYANRKKVVAGYAENLNNYTQKQKENTAALERNSLALKSNEENLNKARVAMEAFKQSMLLREGVALLNSATGAITSLAWAWQSLINLPKIWDNEDLTLSEKIV
jgi:hypothetical protein